MKILILDDEKGLRDSLSEYLALGGIESVLAGSVDQAVSLLERERVDACVVDLRLPGKSGMEFLSWLGTDGPALPAIMISAHGEIKDAVEALKAGASDYLVKPFDPEELSIKLEKAVRQRKTADLIALGRKAGGEIRGAERGGSGKASPWDAFIGTGPSMEALRRTAEKAAATPSTVLITGESGTGKEVLARVIHALSPRAEGPFVAVNSGGIPESLLESELFGHEKGAFTGAEARKPGIFELASGGSLFLDEIGDMPFPLQVKLLRALQERVITRVGGIRTIPVDIRVIAATNRDLESWVAEGRFREDLYYRLNVVRLELLPLRERRGDIPLLAAAFIKSLSASLGKAVRGISDAAVQALMAYDFPGNVRELENAIERAIILAEKEVLEAEDFTFFSSRARLARKPPESPDEGAAAPGGAASGTVRDAERRLIVESLRREGGHRERSAAALGITRRTLLNKMKDYQIAREEWA